MFYFFYVYRLIECLLSLEGKCFIVLIQFCWICTIRKYALTLHHLVFGVLHQLDPLYPHKYCYPSLHMTQLLTLQELWAALQRETAVTKLIPLFQATCYTLFAHHQHRYDTLQHLNQFFSPVICFLLFLSIQEKSGLTPFYSDKDNKNSENFLLLFCMANADDHTKLRQFQNYLEADGPADKWYNNLSQDEKKAWVTVEATFQKCWALYTKPCASWEFLRNS